MELRVPSTVEERLKALERKDRRRIERKLEDIARKVSDLGVDPGKAVEKRLRGPLHPLMQQRVGDWRLWFEEDEENGVLWLRAVKRKEDAAERY